MYPLIKVSLILFKPEVHSPSKCLVWVKKSCHSKTQKTSLSKDLDLGEKGKSTWLDSNHKIVWPPDIITFNTVWTCSRALPDITSGPEVRQIFKVRAVRKPDVFLPGRRTFNRTIIIEKKSKKFEKKIEIFSKMFYFF